MTESYTIELNTYSIRNLKGELAEIIVEKYFIHKYIGKLGKGILLRKKKIYPGIGSIEDIISRNRREGFWLLIMDRIFSDFPEMFYKKFKEDVINFSAPFFDCFYIPDFVYITFLTERGDDGDFQFKLDKIYALEVKSGDVRMTPNQKKFVEITKGNPKIKLIKIIIESEIIIPNEIKISVENE